MGDKRAKWNCVGGVLRGDFPKGGVANIDLKELFPNYASLNKGQQYVVEYGARQACVDYVSGEKDESLKLIGIGVKWGHILSGELTERKESASARANRILNTAPIDRLKIGVELGFYTQDQLDAEIKRRAGEAPAPAPKTKLKKK